MHSKPKTWTLFLTLLFLLVVPAALAMTQEASVHASTVKNGWSKDYYYVNGVKTTGWMTIKNKVYYFSKKGVVQKNKWKTRKEDGVSYYYYLGPDGAAYKASVVKRNGVATRLTNFKTYKIDGATYGFDLHSHACTGIWMSNKATPKLYVFTSKGLYDSKATKSVRSVYEKYYHKPSKKPLQKVTAAFGKPLSIDESYSCIPFDYDPSYPDTVYMAVILTYPHIEISVIHNERNGLYYLEGIFPVMER